MSEPRRPGPTSRHTVTEVAGPASSIRLDTLVTEEPLEIRLGWPGTPAGRLAVTMRTPGADFELAAGFLLSEGVLDPGRPPATVTYCRDPSITAEQLYNVVTVELDGPPRRTPAERFTTVSSACGVCGAQTLDELLEVDPEPIAVTGRFDAALVTSLPGRLSEAQPVFATTGALHAAAVFDFSGALVLAREDIGRHNAVDKVLGARLLGRSSYGEDSILCVSGRIGFDIISKAVRGRIAAVVGVGGPSSLAVRVADVAGITVCGFARGGRFVIYSHPERLSGPSRAERSFTDE